MSGAGVLLDIRGLEITFADPEGPIRALRRLDLRILPGEIHALVGESGSGKSVTAKAVLGLNPVPPAVIGAGSIIFRGRELIGLREEAMREIRGAAISMIFQEPARYLNPSIRIGEQIGEMLMVHRGQTRKDAARSVGELLETVGLDREDARRFAHELSGGMRQRAMIAMAVSCGPELLIADEPTTALDVTIQNLILELILELRTELGMAVLFVSHDLSVVKEIADTVSVVYAGKIVESGGGEELFSEPLHPYTRLLLESVPQPSMRGRPLRTIPGRVPDARAIPTGCAFHPRCPLAFERCFSEQPPFIGHTGTERGAACFMAGKPWE